MRYIKFTYSKWVLRANRLFFETVFLTVLITFCSCQNSSEKSNGESYSTWENYLGGPGRNHFSTLDQITPHNVSQLEIAWTYKAPDSGQMQMNPIIANGMVYGMTAAVQAIALDAETGKEIWRFGDPLKAWHSTSRGVSYWENGVDKRILCTIGPYLYALDARTGKPIESFGTGGKIDLHTGLPAVAADKFVISNTPGTIYKNLIIMPLRLSEGADAAPGDIRAFNVLTGKLEWTFHTIPYPGEEGYATWENPNTYKNTEGVGGANNWAGMAVDEERGILFVPTGSAAPDFYGADRKGQNLYANCLLALDAETGKKRWHFQFTHHDIWDRDPPAPPNLIQVQRDGKRIDALAQVTKQGFIFVFDRETGKPLFDIEEKRVPQSTLPGEQSWPTQPVPTKPKPFAQQSADLTEADLSPFAENKQEVLDSFNNYTRDLYSPPSTKTVLLLPGYDGGAEWGGAGADPEQGILYINANNMAWTLQMEQNDSVVANASTAGESLYNANCAVCHKPDRTGNPQSNYPSLQDLGARLTKQEARTIIVNGKGKMPGFTLLKKEELNSIISFLFEEKEVIKKEVETVIADENSNPLYRHTGYNKFLDSKGLPAIAPPWGTLSAVDLNNGSYLWQVPLGVTEIDGKTEPTGTENYGGPIIAKNGLLFIAATKDGYFRAFDRKTGKLLWEMKLPAASFATPSTYEINGKQYIVLACGGEKLNTPKGNQIIALALPKK